MKAVILAGGLGTRISEETGLRPKPMIEIGGHPLLWHILKIYAAHGVNDFIICAGYKGHMIKEYFANYRLHRSNVTVDLATKDVVVSGADLDLPAIVAAITMIVEMPELGSMDGKQAASLAGLAPITRESGKWKGKSRIGGGRRSLRRALYMPALVAIRHNAQLGQVYTTLCSAGKPAKLAITAVMRKLLLLANALIRDGRKWTETAP